MGVAARFPYSIVPTTESTKAAVRHASRMKILISNDDGYQAPGIRALADALRPLGQITLVAPDQDRSGASNSLTLVNPIRATEVEERVSRGACAIGPLMDEVELYATLCPEQARMLGSNLDALGATDEVKFLVADRVDFDAALAVAPWNDSLRARIYAQYRFLAESRRDPGERAMLMRRASALYPERRD